MIPDQKPPDMLLDLPASPGPTSALTQTSDSQTLPQTPGGLSSKVISEDEEFVARLSEDSSVGSPPPVVHEGSVSCLIASWKLWVKQELLIAVCFHYDTGIKSYSHGIS